MNHEVLADTIQGKQEDIDYAVQSAKEAQVKWAALKPHVRARHMYAIARAVQKHARLIAVVEALDNGKPIRETRDADIPLGKITFLKNIFKFIKKLKFMNTLSCSPLLSPCRMGSTYGRRNARLEGSWRSWCRCSMELSPYVIDMESCTSFGDGKYNCSQTSHLHTIVSFALG